MKPVHALSLLLSCLAVLANLVGPSLRAEVPVGRTQRLKSPDQTPEGLSPSDWAGIRAAYEAGRTEVEATAVPSSLTGDTTPQQAYLKASNTGVNDQFGAVVAVSGDTVVVGAPNESSNATGVNGNQLNNSAYASGAAYVFVRNGTNWTQQAYLKASNSREGDFFGYSVAVSGDTVVVGAYREASNATGVNGNQANNSAFEAGAAYVFVRSGTEWMQQAYLKASNTGVNDQFGYSVAVSGDTVVVGAPLESSDAIGVNGDDADNSAFFAGAAYVFVRSGTTWTQQAYVKASNTGAGDNFGGSVAVSGDMVVIGATGEGGNAAGVNGDEVDNSATYAGAAYVFVRSGTVWTQQAYLKASNPGVGDYFGNSVAVSGDTVVVGAFREDSNATRVNGDQADNSAGSSGAAYVFRRSGTTWRQQAYLKAGNTGTADFFGGSVTVSGDTVVVGAYGEASKATGVNGNQADNSTTNAGAAYVFSGFGPAPAPAIGLGGNGNPINSGDRGTSAVNHTDFGTMTVGVGAVARTFTITNSGSAVLNLTGNPRVALSGSSAFDVTTQPTAATVAANGGMQTFVITFDPSAIGTARATVSIASDDFFESPYTFAITGLGLHPLTIERPAGTALAEEGTSDFGRMAVGASGLPQTFTLVNSGAEDLGGLMLSVEGANAGDFEVSAPSSTTVPAGGSVTFTVTFTPRGSDVRTCLLSYTVDNWPVRRARLSGYGLSPALLSAAQQAYLKASNTGMSDIFGWSVAVSGDTVVVGAAYENSNATGVNGNEANNSVSDSGAAYIFTRSGTVWTQQAYLKASNTGADDRFGTSVAVSGDTVVVGATGESSNVTGANGNQTNNLARASGAAYVFTRSGTVWTQQAYLKASNTGPDNRFGTSVAVSGDTVVVGATGESSNATGVNGNQTNNLARASGAAYVFTRSGTEWTQQAYLKASNTGPGDVFGRSVAVSGDTVVVGATGESSNATGVNGNQANTNNSAFSSGAAYVFTRSGTNWTQQAYLKASNTEASNTGSGDRFGSSVAVSGDTVVVGAHQESSNATGVNGNQADNSAGSSGAAYVFRRSGTTWRQQAYLKASNSGEFNGSGDGFGYSVAVSGDTVIVGAVGEDSNASGVNGNQADNSATDSGAAYVFSSAVTSVILEISQSGDDFLLSFPGEPGLSYRVQYTTSPGAPLVWHEFAPPAIYTAAPDGAVTHRDVNPPDPQRLYRAVPGP